MNEQETKKNTSKNKKLTEAQAPQSTEENVVNTSNNEKYVLYADIMGFKEKVMRTKHEDLKKELKGLREELDDWLSPFLENVKTFKVSFFSDSILIVEESSPRGFQRISIAAAALMAASLKCKFPLKGAIAKGEFTYEEEEQLFFGQAIIDAFLLEEEVHYYGILAHHTMEEDIKKHAKEWVGCNGEINGRIPYVLSPVPLKSGKTSHYHLAYNLISTKREIGVNIETTNKTIISWLEKISGTVSGAPRIYVDNTLQVLKEDLRLYMVTLEKQRKVKFQAFR
jgi:hypothetical protein